jgi:DNA-binding MarR family transcriptional regulator
MSDDPRWGDDTRDRRDNDFRHRDDEVSRQTGRGPGSDDARDEHAEDDLRRRDDDSREFERDRDSRDRNDGLDPRDVFMRDLDLPRGADREIVHDARDREYTLRGSETRTLSTVGAFRVVSARDLRDHSERPADPRSGDLRHLREEGLIRTERLGGRRDVAVVLTKEGRDVLEAHRREHSDDHRQDHRQEFYAGLKKPREVEHDSQVYRAYLRESERLGERGARIDRGPSSDQ